MDKFIDELLKMAQEDQVILATNDPIKQKEVLIKNTDRLKNLIEEHGWPIVSKFGEKAAQAAWLITQHSDHDLEFQKKVLEILKSLPKEEVLSKNIAYLEDRVLVAEGKPQVYGTQFYVDGEGEYGPRPISNEETLEDRWQIMGLGEGLWPTFSDYKDFMVKRFKSK